MRKTIKDIQARKGTDPIVALTAYTAPMAKALDSHCDILLVGDSVAMVLYGEPSTLQADMEMMIRHGRAVQNSSTQALVIVDMPFGSYQESKEVAFRNAARIMKETGATCVKIEGGSEMAETVSYLAQRGVPVVGHIGLQPQSVNMMGGFKAQGRDAVSAQKILEDAKAIDKAGAFCIVVEGVAEALAIEITKTVPCPTVGIGASASCDGQILVAEDMLGMTTGKKPKFVKEYAQLFGDIEKAAAEYATQVRARAFPQKDHLYQSATQPAPSLAAAIIEDFASLKIEEKPRSESLKEQEPVIEPEEKPATPFFNSVLRATRRH